MINNEQNFVEVELRIENSELIEKIETLAAKMQVTPERLIEAIIYIEYGVKGDLPTMNKDKQAEFDDLLYCLDLMYKQSQQAKDSVPIHPNRFKLIRQAVIDKYKSK